MSALASINAAHLERAIAVAAACSPELLAEIRQVADEAIAGAWSVQRLRDALADKRVFEQIGGAA